MPAQLNRPTRPSKGKRKAPKKRSLDKHTEHSEYETDGRLRFHLQTKATLKSQLKKTVKSLTLSPDKKLNKQMINVALRTLSLRGDGDSLNFANLHMRKRYGELAAMMMGQHIADFRGEERYFYSITVKPNVGLVRSYEDAADLNAIFRKTRTYLNNNIGKKAHGFETILFTDVQEILDPEDECLQSGESYFSYHFHGILSSPVPLDADEINERAKSQFGTRYDLRLPIELNEICGTTKYEDAKRVGFYAAKSPVKSSNPTSCAPKGSTSHQPDILPLPQLLLILQLRCQSFIAMVRIIGPSAKQLKKEMLFNLKEEFKAVQLKERTSKISKIRRASTCKCSLATQRKAPTARCDHPLCVRGVIEEIRDVAIYRISNGYHNTHDLD